MTREEAIQVLHHIVQVADASDCGIKEIDGIDEKAIDMAIKALEQEPCEDAISRQAVRHILNHEVKMPIKVWKKVFELVDDLPSVTPQPKTGHWEQYGNFWEDKFKCSECGKEQPKILCGERIIGHWSDYCPNCGAKMVEPQESVDKFVEKVIAEKERRERVNEVNY